MTVDARQPNQRDTYLPGWGPERFIVPLLARRIAEVFEQQGRRPGAGALALDAGCGMQPLRAMLEDVGYHYASLDAIQNRAGTVDWIAPLDGTLPEALLNGPPFDFILCTEVLEHVADWKTAFGNLAQLLAPQGRLLITCPHFYPLHEAPYDFWRPTPYAIEHYAKANGLEVVLLEQLGGPWEVLGTLLAETHAYPAMPRWIDRVLAKICRVARNLVFGILNSPAWQRRVVFKGPYFLSVVAVLQKPVAEPPNPSL
jgi:2-polyprenyl-3-methyl-5-hydroxy-6-metoxy-1,4-benzoquinol methylase